MATKAGVWIDHKQAIVILITDAGQEIKKIKAGAKQNASGSRSSNKYTPNDFVAEDRRERKLLISQRVQGWLNDPPTVDFLREHLWHDGRLLAVHARDRSYLAGYLDDHAFLLHALLERPGAVLSRAQLEERLYAWTTSVESNAVEFIIHSVRKRLGAAIIENIRGVGWRIGTNP